MQVRQGDALKAAREKGIAGKGWQSRAKSHMLGCLDIDFCEWDAADIARQWRRLMRQESGGHLPPGIADNQCCFCLIRSEGFLEPAPGPSQNTTPYSAGWHR